MNKVMKYEWMVRFTPHEAWISGKGLYLWLAFFFTEIGAGAYFVSLFLDFPPGLLVGLFVLPGMGGIFHMLYLGKPSRGWRIMMKFGNSELSRGLWATGFFGGMGVLQVAPYILTNILGITNFLPWTYNSTFLNVIMGILSILVVMHGFTTMFAVRALPMWNSSMMLPLSLASGLWMGGQIVSVMCSLFGGDVAAAEIWSRWTLLFFAGSLLLYLFGTYHSSENAKASLNRLFAGDLASVFYLAVVVVGIVIPMIITLVGWNSASPLGGGALFLRLVCVFFGDACMRYTVMKAPMYTPLV